MGSQQNSQPTKPEVTRKPQCQHIRLGNKGERMRCTGDGVACWVTGEFGRSAMMLCNPCIHQLRVIGWKVRYQIEGDNPPPLPDSVSGETR